MAETSDNKQNNNILINKNDKYHHMRNKTYGVCSTCNRYNTYFSWCQSCDTYLLTQGWTSGNQKIDELIKNTQIDAPSYDKNCFFEWIPYDQFKNIELVGGGGFATIYKATWINGDKYTDTENNVRCRKNRTVALKRLNDS